MKSAFKVRKLDARFNGHDHFTHLVEYRKWAGPHLNLNNIVADGTALFLEHRQWCWQSFGPGCELEFFRKTDHQIVWAWQTDAGLLRLYLNGRQLAWFQLKWVTEQADR